MYLNLQAPFVLWLILSLFAGTVCAKFDWLYGTICTLFSTILCYYLFMGCKLSASFSVANGTIDMSFYTLLTSLFCICIACYLHGAMFFPGNLDQDDTSMFNLYGGICFIGAYQNWFVVYLSNGHGKYTKHNSTCFFLSDNLVIHHIGCFCLVYLSS
jgi:hypothetical protein